jgi:hypothetical protein
VSGIDGLALPGPKIDAVSVDNVTASILYSVRAGSVCDWALQNLSGNNVYILQYVNQPVAKALKVVSGGNSSKDNWTGDLILIADGAASDVRYMLQIHPQPWPGSRMISGDGY